MYANYHTHTPLCNHAQGDEREYIECAIEGGIKILGFSDHAPMPFPPSHYSSYRMKLSETAGYINKLQALREEYKKDIDIKIGFEAEYFPALFDSLMSFLSDYEYDYLILGQHFNKNEYDCEHYNGRPTSDESILDRFYKQMLEGFSTGKFIYIAHPDLLQFTGDKKIYQKHTEGFCRAAAERGIPLEVNMLGKAVGRNYPNALFWDIAAHCGCTAIIGCDAHSPEYLKDKKLYETVRSIPEKRGMTILDSIEF